MEKHIALDEPILDDDYPVHFDYLYVADGKVIRSDIRGTVLQLKRITKSYEIRRCDITGRRKNTNHLNG
jgi:hypothetical protein